MMERTDRHCRYLLRLISPETRLYTEMITAAALVQGGRLHLLDFHPSEHPVALQLGGSDPGELARAAALGAAAGYDEINLNVGCPSDRVQSGRFGAALMAEPRRVAACLRAMMETVDVAVTVKTRTGIDDLDSYEFLRALVDAVAEAGCGTVIIHARKAILSGLSPKQNRQVPPLDYGRVYRLKSDFPGLRVVLNGGLDSEAKVLGQSGRVDGVMLGRHAYGNPWVLAELDPQARSPPWCSQPGGRPERLPAAHRRRGWPRHLAQGDDPPLGGFVFGPSGRPGMAAVPERAAAGRNRFCHPAAPRRLIQPSASSTFPCSARRRSGTRSPKVWKYSPMLSISTFQASGFTLSSSRIVSGAISRSEVSMAPGSGR